MYIGMWGRSWVCMDLREELGMQGSRGSWVCRDLGEELGMQGSRGGAGYAGI